MSPKRELEISYHAVSRYIERVEHQNPPRVIYEPVYNRIRPKILEIVERGRLLDTRECALFVRMAANVVSGSRRLHAPVHWGHYYYDEAACAIAVVNHDHTVTTVLVPDDLQLEHLQRFKKRADPEVSGVQVRSEILPLVSANTEPRGEDLEICVSDGAVPDAVSVKSWVNNHASGIVVVWMDEGYSDRYPLKSTARSMPRFGGSLTDPSTDAIWFIREILDKELQAPRRIVCGPEWAMFILLSLVGREAEIPHEGIGFLPGTVYALSLSGERPKLVGVRKI